MEKKSVTFTLSVENVNIILAALAKQPFEIVAELITNLRTDAEKQLNTTEGEEE